MINFDDWCYHAVAQIRFKPDRDAVFRELKDHLEDHYDSLLCSGYAPEDAKRLALEAMGDPEEIAPQLGAIHKPWMGYLYRTVKWITVPLCVWALFLLIAFTGSHIHAVLSTANYPALQQKADGGLWLQPKVSATCDGYHFRITEAAVNAEGDTLYLELQTTYWPWMQRSEMTYCFYALDSLGNIYASREEAGYDDIPKVIQTGGYFSQGFSCENLEVIHFDSNAQWVELRYERDGREIILRIDLTGGSEQ